MRNKHDTLNCVAGDQIPSVDEVTRADLEHVTTAARQWHLASSLGGKNDHACNDRSG